MSHEWLIEIDRDGMWPTKWRWKVQRITRNDHGHFVNSDRRFGEAFTKDHAHRKAAKARLSIERDDLRITETVDA